MISIQHTETDRNGLFEAWLGDTQVGEMTYQRPTPHRMIIDHTRVFDTRHLLHIVYQLANFKKAATSQTSKMCSETYFLVSGKREKRCNINFLPQKLAYVRINGVSLYSRSF